MTPEDMEEMINDPCKRGEFLARIRHSTQHVQGSPAFWGTKRKELFALVEQKGDPTIFYTYSIADNHFPELHALLPHVADDPSCSERTRMAIANSIVVDEYAYHRCKDMVQQFVQKTLGSTYDYTRVEYQCRGVLHVHGCAKLSTDPGMKELSRKIVQGHVAECTLDDDDNTNMIDPDDLKKIESDIAAGVEATKAMLAYHDWLIDTMNPNPHPTPPESTLNCIPAHPRYQRPENYPWHPSSLRHEDVPQCNRTLDTEVMLNSFCRHTRHDQSCLRTKPKKGKAKAKGPGDLPECRFKAPHELEDESRVEVVQNEDKKFQVIVKSKRNDPLLNSANPTQRSWWRANCDLQLVTDPIQVTAYMLKYTCKAEQTSGSARKIIQEAATGMNISGVSGYAGKRFCRKLMMRTIGGRDISAAEAGHCVMSTPLTFSSETFVSIALKNDRRIAPTEHTVGRSLMDLYAGRTEPGAQTPELQMLGSVNVDWATMDLQTFCRTYDRAGSKAPLNNQVKLREKEAVAMFFPSPPGDPKGKRYAEYCWAQLLKFKPWQKEPSGVWGGAPGSKGTPAEWISAWEAYKETKEFKAKGIVLFSDREGMDTETDQARHDVQQQQEADEARTTHCIGADAWAPAGASVEGDYGVDSAARKYGEWLAKRGRGMRSDEEWAASGSVGGAWHSQIDSLAGFLEAMKSEQNPDWIRQPLELAAGLVMKEKQQLAVSICLQHAALKETDPTTPQLLMIVYGEAGTGKSVVLSAIRTQLGNKCAVVATTGVAAFNVAGETAHSYFGLPTHESQERDLSDEALKSGQDRMKDVTCICLDEMSMLGAKSMGWLDRRCQELKCSNEPLGGLDLIMFGDFAQLPPVKATAMTDAACLKSADKMVVLGHEMFNLFLTVVILNEQMRAAEDPEWRCLLGRLKDGQMAPENVTLLKSRFVGTPTLTPEEETLFASAVRLFSTNKEVEEYNAGFQMNRNIDIAIMHAQHSSDKVPCHCCSRESARERDGETERQRKRERERVRERDRSLRERERERDLRERETERDRKREREREREISCACAAAILTRTWAA